MSAPLGSVWALHADFPNLASHWSGLRATRAIGDQTAGVGAVQAGRLTGPLVDRMLTATFADMLVASERQAKR